MQARQPLKKSTLSKLLFDREYTLNQEELDKILASRLEMFGQTMPAEYLTAFKLEWKGGECPRCHKQFEPTYVFHANYAKDKDTGEVLNGPDGKPIILRVFADFILYVPSCHCYKRCDVSGIHVKSWEKGESKMVVARTPGCGNWLIAERLLQDSGVPQKNCLSCGRLIL